MIIFDQNWLYSGKFVVCGQGGCIRAEVVVFRQMWLLSCKKGSFRVKVVVFGQAGCFLAKVVAFVQNGCIRRKMIVFGQK